MAHTITEELEVAMVGEMVEDLDQYYLLRRLQRTSRPSVNES
jgi:hypothetical protein